MQPKSSSSVCRSRRAGLVPLALLAMTVAVVSNGATAQQIVKWTDESGHVHYSDHAPPGHTPVNGVALPKTSAGNAISAPAAPGDASAPAYKARTAEGAGLASDFDAEETADAAKRAQNQQRQAQQQAVADAKRKSDQAVIDRCKEQHNLNCKDAAGIREREHMAALMQCTNPAGCQAVQKIWQDQQNAGN